MKEALAVSNYSLIWTALYDTFSDTNTGVLSNEISTFVQMVIKFHEVINTMIDKANENRTRKNRKLVTVSIDDFINVMEHDNKLYENISFNTTIAWTEVMNEIQSLSMGNMAWYAQFHKIVNKELVSTTNYEFLSFLSDLDNTASDCGLSEEEMKYVRSHIDITKRFFEDEKNVDVTKLLALKQQYTNIYEGCNCGPQLQSLIKVASIAIRKLIPHIKLFFVTPRTNNKNCRDNSIYVDILKPFSIDLSNEVQKCVVILVHSKMECSMILKEYTREIW